MNRAFKKQMSVPMAFFLITITLKRATHETKTETGSVGPHLGDDLEAQFGHGSQKSPNIFEAAANFSHFQETPEEWEVPCKCRHTHVHLSMHLCPGDSYPGFSTRFASSRKSLMLVPISERQNTVTSTDSSSRGTCG